MSVTIDLRRSPLGREFRIMGSSHHPVSVATRERLFVTGPYARTTSWSSPLHIASVHAKQVGSITTVCGLGTTSWATLWEVPFRPSALEGACPDCRRRAGERSDQLRRATPR